MYFNFAKGNNRVIFVLFQFLCAYLIQFCVYFTFDAFAAFLFKSYKNRNCLNHIAKGCIYIVSQKKYALDVW